MAIIILGVAHGCAGTAPPPGAVTLSAGTTRLARIPLRPLVRGGQLDRGALARAVTAAIPATTTTTAGAATITLRYNTAAAAADARRAPLRGTTIAVPVAPVSAQITAPLVTQKETNDCEATALQMLLSTEGVTADQLTLQSELPVSQPVAPTTTGGQEVWGDPDLGFVGRADGGAPAGGFGVYQGPIAALARRYGHPPLDLTGMHPTAVYRRLLAGHAVMAWVGLSDGPLAHWRSPAGREIDVNFGEHAVLLTGLAQDGTLTVNNPLDATVDHWTEAQFETMWARLGNRALSA